MTTMRDVARVAGVSAKTVSRVFNDDPHVTQETRERVRWAMQKLNYVPNLLAKSFRAGADTTVGLAIPDIADPFFAEMTSSIEIDLMGRGMAVVVTSLGHGPDRERYVLEALLRRQLSGLIVACVSADQSYLAPWQERLNALGLSVNLVALVHSVLDNLQTGAVDLVGPIQQVAVASISVIGTVLIISILSIYIAIDRKRILAFLFRLTPSSYRTEAELLRVSVNRSFGGFLRGQVIMGAVYGLITAVVSVIFGLKLIPITATAAGVLMAIPFFGPFVAWVPPVLDALIFNPDLVLPVAILVGIGWIFVMNVLQPRLMAGAVGLHPVVVLGSVIIGGKIAGVAGAIFGIPIAAIVTAFFWHYLEEQSGETVAQRAARRVERREGRRIRVPTEPKPGIDPEVEDEGLDESLSAGASSSH